ncbi:adenosine deaminase [Legionella lansingensis]|uniref:adenosine deaminase n=1 Tax=Legionella lansingensis TaxID=45067 RepID=A0A0W0VUW7_9GAMM|nr:adenosine deaminase [Legionella lansingensis]KTD23839.1 adenosine deaminase [Legionella lansingensis]SNV46745.1 adenosine deaminase [Legionella lansingensis]
MRFFKFTIFLFFLGWQSLVLADINHYFNDIKNDPNALYTFLKQMPKGGELHYHLAGGAYPEKMLTIAARENYCLDKGTFAVSKRIEECQSINVQELMNQPTLYDKTIQAWSMKNFNPGNESGHDHFFNSFSKFMPVVLGYSPELLADIMQRAANQHEQYLEIMILPDNARSSFFGTPDLLKNTYANAQKKLLADKAFQENIKFTIDESADLLKKTRKKLGCTQSPNQEVCQLTVRFQYYVLREQPLEKVFAQALNAFAAASNSKDIVAVNLVQPEDGIISLRDYHQQMQIFAFLRKAYPAVHLSLHAGELAPSFVEPNDLNFHINEAVHIAHAERIGHGTAIAYEDNSEDLLRTMATKQIPIEINLTSNREILGCYGKAHPLRYYLTHNVPVVLSTDDEGILRTDLTREYVEAVLNHDIDYPTLKLINRNALTYSFLPGKSLWADPKEAKPISECANFQSQSCLQFIKNNEKAKLQWQLEEKLSEFEKTYLSKAPH